MENIFKNPEMRELLEKGLEEIGRKWGHYCRYSKEVTQELREADYIIDLRFLANSVKDDATRWGLYVKKILGRKPHQIILVPHYLFPTGSHLGLAKDGNTIKVSRSFEEPLDKAVLDAWGKIKTGEIYVGTDWEGHHHSDHAYRVFTHVDNLRAQIVKKHLKKKGLVPNIADYSGNIDFRGGTQINIHGIPSLTSSKVYTIRARHIPVYKGKTPSREVIDTGYDLCEYPHDCAKPEWHNVKDARNIITVTSGKRRGEQKFLDTHFILGFKLIAEDLKEKGYNVIDPFLEMTKLRKYEFFFRQLPYVIKEKRRGKRIERSHLDLVEMDISMGQLLGSNNYLREQRRA